MSKPRYNWWPFALNMIRDYPVRDVAYKELHKQNVTADLSGMPRGGGASRTTEGVSLRQLQPQEQREYDAVSKAIARIRRMKDAKSRLDVVRLTMWRSYTIPGAALAVSVSENTARRYRWQFIMLVGRMYGFLTEEEYQKEVKYEILGRKLESHSQKTVI